MTKEIVKITRRESQILQLIVEGKSSRQVALGLHISLKTVETHRKSLLAKFGATNACNMVYLACKNGIV